jgi:hypothetical protein
MKNGRMLNARCRRIIKKESAVSIHYIYVYEVVRDHQRVARTAGKLVAKHFIPNPNGYMCVRYKDGNPANSHYLNIEWVKTALRATDGRGSVKIHQTREEQILAYEERIREASQQVEYLKEGRVVELVYEMYLPALKKFADCRLRKTAEDLREDFISFATDELLDKIKRGLVLFTVKPVLINLYREFWKAHEKTVEYNDAIIYQNESI